MPGESRTNPTSLPPTPDGWREMQIEELCERVTSGGTPSRQRPEFYENGVFSWFKTKELKDCALYHSEERITQDALDSSSAKLFPPNTVLMAMYGDGITITSLGILRRQAATNQACCAMIPKSTVCEPRFLFYSLLNHREDFIRIASGGAQRNLSGSLIRRFALNAPPLAEQKAIAAVLGALDDKIELNRRMNATLEAMARALFQSWFVDFDPVRAKLDGRPPADLDPATAALFPASLQESSLGPIPHGWRAAHLEEIASVGSGKRPEGRCDVLSPECKIPLYGGGGRMGYVPSALYDKPILFTGRVGTLGLIFRTAEPSWPSDNTLIVEPQAGLFDFTYFVLKGFDLITLNRGSTQPLLTQTDLKRQTLVLPTKDVVKAFADVSEPIFRQMVSNERESRTLATLRDTLLPKLLSGELSVAATDNESLSVQKTSKGG
jgi:type I restriction enzyme S subunit